MTIAQYQVDMAQLYTTGARSVPLAGDCTFDGMVNAANYVLQRKNGGTQEEYNRWRANFGQSVGSGSISNPTVPKPASTLFLILGQPSDAGERRRLTSRVPKLIGRDTR